MIEIRLASPVDAAKLPDVERSAGEAFLRLVELQWIADNDPLPIDHHLVLIAQGTTWVAVHGEEIIGFLSAERVEALLHIEEISVRSEAQRMGVGRRLIQAAQTWSLENRLAAITLTTFRGVAWNEPFYQSCGFRTLEPAELGERLTSLMEDEALEGLLLEQRCAMLWQV